MQRLARAKKRAPSYGDGERAISESPLSVAVERLCNASSGKHRQAYIALLERCIREGSLVLGRKLHQRMASSSPSLLDEDAYFGNLIIKMYAKCGSPEEAVAAFGGMRRRDSHSWGNVIAACARHGRGREAIAWSRRMHQQGVKPNGFTFVSCLAACSAVGGAEGLAKGRKIHSRIVESGIGYGEILGTALIDMYGKCGNDAAARAVFDQIPEASRTIFTWTSMVAAYASSGHGQEALKLYRAFNGKPDWVMLVGVISACTGVGDLEQGRKIHDQVKQQGLDGHTIVGNALISMYGKCRRPADARAVFDRLSTKTSVSWNSMIAAYSQEGHRREAMLLLREMDPEGVKGDAVTFVNAAACCASREALEDGREIHRRAAVAGVEADVVVATALLNMYGKCKSVGEARRVFDGMVERNTVSWTAMVTAYAQNGRGEEALLLFKEMERQGLNPDVLTFLSVLDACSSLGAIQEGTEIHRRIREAGFESDIYLKTALINMYGRCGTVEFARELFLGMEQRNSVAWSTMIAAYTQNGHPREALELYRSMDVEPSEVTFLEVLGACSALGALAEGRAVHARIVASPDRCESLQLGNALVNMYGKCASLEDAESTFRNLAVKNLVTWTAMMVVYAQLGQYERALEVLYEMEQSGMKPDEVTMTVALFCCSHAGKLKEGRRYLLCMQDDYGLRPTFEHFDGMVDLLARGGLLTKAEDLIENMPFEPNTVTWTTLLSACKLYSSLDAAENAAEKAAELDPPNPGPYLLLSSLLSERRDLLEEKLRTSGFIKERERTKMVARCFIEVKGKVHEFVAGSNTVHLHKAETDLELWRINRDIVKEGAAGLKAVVEEQNHPAKRAVAFGLVTTLPGTTLRVVKNLKLCAQCHHAIRFLSKSRKRHIIIRDYTRFHEFRDGVCSCGSKCEEDKRGSLGGCYRRNPPSLPQLQRPDLLENDEPETPIPEEPQDEPQART